MFPEPLMIFVLVFGALAGPTIVGIAAVEMLHRFVPSTFGLSR